MPLFASLKEHSPTTGKKVAVIQPHHPSGSRAQILWQPESQRWPYHQLNLLTSFLWSIFPTRTELQDGRDLPVSFPVEISCPALGWHISVIQ